DKIRPMADSITAILVQRPTYLLLRFDCFVDLVLAAWAENLRSLLSRRPRRALPPPDGTPESAARKQWRRHETRRLTGLIVLAVALHLVFQGVTLWTTTAQLGALRTLLMLRHMFARFITHLGLAALVILLARLLRLAMWKAEVRPAVRRMIYRGAVLAAAILFLDATFRMFWLPLALAALAYLLWDAFRTLRGVPLTEKDPLRRDPLDADLAAALRILEQPDCKTVVFGHTHAPVEVTVEGGRRFI